MISGIPDISVDDLQQNTEYSGYSPQDSLIAWFWQILRAFDQQKRASLIQFVTGTSRVPADGFKSLRGKSGLQKFNIKKE